MADSNGWIIHWSTAAEHLIGGTADHMVGQSLDVIVPQEYRDAHWAAFRRVMAGEPGKLDGASARIPVRCADGQVRTFPGRFNFIRDPDDNVCAAMATYRDGQHDAAPFSPISKITDEP